MDSGGFKYCRRSSVSSSAYGRGSPDPSSAGIETIPQVSHLAGKIPDLLHSLAQIARRSGRCLIRGGRYAQTKRRAIVILATVPHFAQRPLYLLNPLPPSERLTLMRSTPASRAMQPSQKH